MAKVNKTISLQAVKKLLENSFENKISICEHVCAKISELKDSKILGTFENYAIVSDSKGELFKINISDSIVIENKNVLQKESLGYLSISKNMTDLNYIAEDLIESFVNNDEISSKALLSEISQRTLVKNK